MVQVQRANPDLFSRDRGRQDERVGRVGRRVDPEHRRVGSRCGIVAHDVRRVREDEIVPFRVRRVPSQERIRERRSRPTRHLRDAPVLLELAREAARRRPRERDVVETARRRRSAAGVHRSHSDLQVVRPRRGYLRAHIDGANRGPVRRARLSCRRPSLGGEDRCPARRVDERVQHHISAARRPERDDLPVETQLDREGRRAADGERLVVVTGDRVVREEVRRDRRVASRVPAGARPASARVRRGVHPLRERPAADIGVESAVRRCAGLNRLRVRVLAHRLVAAVGHKRVQVTPGCDVPLDCLLALREPVVSDSDVLELAELVEVRVPRQAPGGPRDGDVVRPVPVEVANCDGGDRLGARLIHDDLRRGPALPAPVVLVVPHIAVRRPAGYLGRAVSCEIADCKGVAIDADEIVHHEPGEDDVPLGVEVPPVQHDLAVVVVDEDAAHGVQVPVAIEVDVDDRDGMVRALAGPREPAVLDPARAPSVDSVQVLIVVRVVFRAPCVVRRGVRARDHVELVQGGDDDELRRDVRIRFV